MVVVILFAGSAEVAIDLGGADISSASIEKAEVVVNGDEGIAKITSVEIKNDTVYAKVEALGRGKGYLDVLCDGELIDFRIFYVHRFNIISVDNYFGNVNYGWIFPMCFVIMFVLITYTFAKRTAVGIKKCLYSYENITYLALTWVSFVIMMEQARLFLGYKGPIESLERLMGTASRISFILFPIALCLSVFVMFTNIRLLKKEGVRAKNILGTILGFGIVFLTFLPDIVYRILSTMPGIDIHNANGIPFHVESYFEYTVYSLTAYLECVLFASVIIAIVSAKHVPKFDKDYIIILGAKMRKDGSLTPLLKGRVDRAIEFAKMQKEATGKDIIFVPSGGQGSDEPLSEGDAMKNYLLSTGIPEEKILAETASLNTYQNFTYSKKLIDEHFKGTDASIAFSTTNYHVLRSGFYADKQGIKAEGIGSRTKAYFWVNAFVREFIATMEVKAKTHILAFTTIAGINALFMLIIYYSNNT
jgi:uncharacterized SAM-binding protein YcdF (DUF218 family)